MKFMKILLVAGLGFGLMFCASAPKKPDNEKNPQYQYEKAVIAMKYGLSEQAVGYIHRALSLDPHHVPAWYLLGLIRFQSGDYAAAAESFDKCLEIKADHVDALNKLGESYQKLDRKDEADNAFRRAFDVDENAFAGFNLAKSLFAANRLEDALSLVDKVIRKSEREAGAYNLKGVILNQMERYPEAMATFRTALAIAPSDVALNVNLGIACMNAKQYGEARLFFERSLPLVKDQALKDKITEYLRLLKESGN